MPGRGWFLPWPTPTLSCQTLLLLCCAPVANLFGVFFEVVPGGTAHPGAHVAVPLVGCERGEQAVELVVSHFKEPDGLLQRQGLQFCLPLIIVGEGIPVILCHLLATQVRRENLESRLLPAPHVGHHILDRPGADRAGPCQLVLAQSIDGRGEGEPGIIDVFENFAGTACIFWHFITLLPGHAMSC